jgi:putative phosphoesterase
MRDLPRIESVAWSVTGPDPPKRDRARDTRNVQALLYDFHGNLPALEAVLADARSAGADRFLLGGDYALFGAWPRETVERLRELDADWIRGNVDRWTASPADAPQAVQGAIEACRELLGDELVVELAELPETLTRGGTLYCHASPGSDMRSFLPEPADDEPELLVGVEAERLVFGHTHLPFRRMAAGGIELVNPGSVGMPFDGDHRASYALLHDDGRLENRRVAYDHEASARAIRERLGEAGGVPALRVEQARFDVE